MAKAGSSARDPRSIAEILAASAALRNDAHVSWWTWQRIVGERVATRSQPERVEGKTLWVIVQSSAWANELSLLSSMIVERLRRARIDVHGLRFRVGNPSIPARPEPLRPVIPKPLPEGLEERLAALDYAPELQLAIRTAAALSRR